MIGLITNDGISSGGNKIFYAYQNFFKLGLDLFLIPLTNFTDIKNKITKCRGIIMQGGDDFLPIHKKIIKYLYDNDIPLLAICMSMQAMGVLFNGELDYIKNHQSKDKYVHYIIIKEDTLLYNILKKRRILVNSSHKQFVTKTSLTISGVSNCIEAIEDKDKKFFLGLQWHPEKMVDYDLDQMKIFEYFKGVCNGFK